MKWAGITQFLRVIGSKTKNALIVGKSAMGQKNRDFHLRAAKILHSQQTASTKIKQNVSNESDGENVTESGNQINSLVVDFSRKE